MEQNKNICALRPAIPRIQGIRRGARMPAAEWPDWPPTHSALGADLFAPLREGIHEFVAAEAGDGPACAGLALAIARVLHREASPACVWIAATETGSRPSARGIADFGLDPGLVMHISACRPIQAFWSTEEAIRSGAIPVVMAELPRVDFTTTRRFLLAAAGGRSRASGVAACVFLLLPAGHGGASACISRWRVGCLASAADQHDSTAPGAPRWKLSLERCRFAPRAVGRCFDLEFCHDTRDLRMVDGLAAGAVTPPCSGRSRRAS